MSSPDAVLNTPTHPLCFVRLLAKSWWMVRAISSGGSVSPWTACAPPGTDVRPAKLHTWPVTRS